MRQLIRVAVEWDDVRVGTPSVIGAAVDALVAGLDSTALRELAGARPRDDIDYISDLVSQTMTDLSVPIPESGSTAADQLLRGYACDDFLLGRADARSVTRSAYSRLDYGDGLPSDDLIVLGYNFDESDAYERSAQGAADATGYARAYLAWLNRPELFESTN